ncbi:hypothetical protein L3X38_026649 [Prunus dulcis]|uniref:Uncharacterized protein n=1 Tax=Prunus dulcis TaxID=3755 RepID=A0AAD4VMN8_PRUDU|nr:hypothetical protein L3X38_026649 [Prunus dulcis]
MSWSTSSVVAWKPGLFCPPYQQYPEILIGEEGCGALTGASDGDEGREIRDGILGEGELAASCGNGVGEGYGGDDKDTIENWNRRKARSRA